MRCPRMTRLRRYGDDGNLNGFLAQSPPLEQLLRCRQSPTEGGVELVRIARAAGRIDVIMELLRGGRIKNVAGLLERRKCIGVEHLRPKIAVISRGVAVAREYVLEMSGPVAHDDLARHADARERLLLEAADVEGFIGRGAKMHVEIDEGRGDVFHRRLPL